jgi:hypothetical protein
MRVLILLSITYSGYSVVDSPTTPLDSIIYAELHPPENITAPGLSRQGFLNTELRLLARPALPSTSKPGRHISFLFTHFAVAHSRKCQPHEKRLPGTHFRTAIVAMLSAIPFAFHFEILWSTRLSAKIR